MVLLFVPWYYVGLVAIFVDLRCSSCDTVCRCDLCVFVRTFACCVMILCTLLWLWLCCCVLLFVDTICYYMFVFGDPVMWFYVLCMSIFCIVLDTRISVWSHCVCSWLLFAYWDCYIVWDHYYSLSTLCICWLLMSPYFAIETAVLLHDIILDIILLLCSKTLCFVLCYCGLFWLSSSLFLSVIYWSYLLCCVETLYLVFWWFCSNFVRLSEEFIAHVCA